jgi:phasin family protein
MARKSSTKPTASKRSSTRKPRAKASPASEKGPGRAAPGGADFGDMAKMARAMTPEKAFELYKANAKLALDVINTAIENTSKLRKLQFEGEEQTRSMQRKAIRHAAEASDPQSMVAAGQSVSQEAVEKAMQYWSEMFSMIVEMQKRLFALMEDQMAGVPGQGSQSGHGDDARQRSRRRTAGHGGRQRQRTSFFSIRRVMGDFAPWRSNRCPAAAILRLAARGRASRRGGLV